jgi:hypothetical protein
MAFAGEIWRAKRRASAAIEEENKKMRAPAA